MEICLLWLKFFSPPQKVRCYNVNVLRDRFLCPFSGWPLHLAKKRHMYELEPCTFRNYNSLQVWTVKNQQHHCFYLFGSFRSCNMQYSMFFMLFLTLQWWSLTPNWTQHFFSTNLTGEGKINPYSCLTSHPTREKTKISLQQH